MSPFCVVTSPSLRGSRFFHTSNTCFVDFPLFLFAFVFFSSLPKLSFLAFSHCGKGAFLKGECDMWLCSFWLAQHQDPLKSREQPLSKAGGRDRITIDLANICAIAAQYRTCTPKRSLLRDFQKCVSPNIVQADCWKDHFQSCHFNKCKTVQQLCVWKESRLHWLALGAGVPEARMYRIEFLSDTVACFQEEASSTILVHCLF